MELEQIGGQHFYYLESCHRQLWLYIHRVDMEEGFEAVEMGALLHEQSYKREQKELSIAGFKVDFISRDGYVHETKSSKRTKTVHLYQPMFYVYYLNEQLGYNLKGVKIHYPNIKEVVVQAYDGDWKEKIEARIADIQRIAASSSMPPLHSNRKLCKKCAYQELCYA